MEKKDIKKLKGIVEEARRLEKLIAEIEGGVSEVKDSHLNLELFCIGDVSKASIGDIVSCIDNALHHSNEYPEPVSEADFKGDAESVYEALCTIRDKWKILFQGKKVYNSHAYLLFSNV